MVIKRRFAEPGATVKARTIRRFVTAGVAGLSVAVAGLCMATASVATYNRASAIFPAGDTAHGKKLAAICVACHGETPVLIGTHPFHPPKIAHQRPVSIFYALQDYSTGARKSEIMAAVVAGLSEQDMRDLSAYFAGPVVGTQVVWEGGGGNSGPNDRHPGVAQSGPGRDKVVTLCGFCHGMTGQGEMDGVPRLGGQQQDYLKHALAAYESGARTDATMGAIVKKVTPEDIEAITAYLSAQSGLDVAR